MTTNNKSIIPYEGDGSENIFDKKNCKLCASKHKKEAEECYADGKSMKFVQKTLLEEKFKEEISYPAVRNHLLFHYEAQQRNIQLNEWQQDLIRWMGSEQSRETEMKIRMAILKKAIVRIDLSSEGLSLEEQRKSSSEITKIVGAMLACEKALDEKNKEIDPARRIVVKLGEIISAKIKANASQETKAVLASIADELKDAIETIED